MARTAGLPRNLADAPGAARSASGERAALAVLVPAGRGASPASCDVPGRLSYQQRALGECNERRSGCTVGAQPDHRVPRPLRDRGDAEQGRPSPEDRDGRVNCIDDLSLPEDRKAADGHGLQRRRQVEQRERRLHDPRQVAPDVLGRLRRAARASALPRRRPARSRCPSRRIAGPFRLAGRDGRPDDLRDRDGQRRGGNDRADADQRSHRVGQDRVR